VIEKSLARASEHVVDLVEPVVAAVVGVGDILGAGQGWVEGAHEVELRFWGAEFDEVAFVGGVHGDDPLEAFDVG